MFANHNRVQNKNGNHGKAAAAIVLAALVLLIAAPLCTLAAEPPAVGVQDKNLGEDYHKAEAALAKKAELERGDEGFWSYALSTLIIRFVGIFVVLAILQVIMQTSGRLFAAYEKKKKAAASK